MFYISLLINVFIINSLLLTKLLCSELILFKIRPGHIQNASINLKIFMLMFHMIWKTQETTLLVKKYLCEVCYNKLLKTLLK